MRAITGRRTIFEVPTMDDYKWAKIPSIAADVFFADIEDTVPPALKERARQKVVDAVGDPSHFGGREVLCRPNNLSTPWGRDDLEALAEAGAPFVLYPKARSADELHELNAIFARAGRVAEIMVLVETPQAVLALEEILSCANVSSLMFGPGDLSVELGIGFLGEEEPFRDGLLYARSKCVMVGRMLGLEVVEGAVVRDVKNLAAVRRSAEYARRLGFTGMASFYPAQVPIINEVMSPSAEEIAWARTALAAYDEGEREGRGASSVDGRAVTVHERQVAERLLAVAAALEERR
jgi:citrate lyase beta subunit